MIVTEYYATRFDGVVLNHTYSNNNKILIRNDGVEFADAVDIEGCGYTYTESNRNIKTPENAFEPDTYDPDEATAEDYQAELRRLGVMV